MGFSLARHVRDVALKSVDRFVGVPAESYEFAHQRLAWETIQSAARSRVAAAQRAFAG
jgi:hypothetical protein